MGKKGYSGLGSGTTLLVLGVLIVGAGIYLFTGKNRLFHHSTESRPLYTYPTSTRKANLARYKTGEMFYLEEQPISLLYNDY